MSDIEMEGNLKNIRDLSVSEREEVLANIADTLEGSAREALMEGNESFATTSRTMASAIKENADELARDNLDIADQVVQQALNVIAQFRMTHPYRVVNTTLH
ncbi:hypothetical protein QDY28_29290 [Rhizobium sp. BR 362]